MTKTKEAITLAAAGMGNPTKQHALLTAFFCSLLKRGCVMTLKRANRTAQHNK